MFSQFTHQHHKTTNQHPIYMVTADRHAGKTTFIKEMIVWFENHHFPFAGFISEGLWDEQGNRSGFNLIALPAKHSHTLCDRISVSWDKHESYYFNPNTVERGKQALLKAPPGAVVIIDEVGRFELDGKLWANALTEIISRNQNPIIMAVRTPFVNEVILKWNLFNVKIIDATTDCPEVAAKNIST
jgi:nucleoside-triphosphatase